MTDFGRRILANEEKQALCDKRGAYLLEAKERMVHIHWSHLKSTQDLANHARLACHRQMGREFIVTKTLNFKTFIKNIERLEAKNQDERSQLEKENRALYQEWKAWRQADGPN